MKCDSFSNIFTSIYFGYCGSEMLAEVPKVDLELHWFRATNHWSQLLGVHVGLWTNSIRITAILL